MSGYLNKYMTKKGTLRKKFKKARPQMAQPTKALVRKMILRQEETKYMSKFTNAGGTNTAKVFVSCGITPTPFILNGGIQQEFNVYGDAGIQGTQNNMHVGNVISMQRLALRMVFQKDTASLSPMLRCVIVLDKNGQNDDDGSTPPSYADIWGDACSATGDGSIKGGNTLDYTVMRNVYTGDVPRYKVLRDFVVNFPNLGIINTCFKKVAINLKGLRSRLKDLNSESIPIDNKIWMIVYGLDDVHKTQLQFTSRLYFKDA